ncbi:MAG: CRISPR-associated endonuclease Cas1 [Lachnospiraceae bacterium]|nr:CRISPR-associated endonuclease Cas1 [Lachnospiraceae bacterium]
MSLLYINENGTIIGVEGNRFTVRYKDGMIKSIPVETLESITVLGIVQITWNSAKSPLL